MSTVEALIDSIRDVWDAYNEHPFVKGIEQGTLDRDRFRFYLIQDYLYLEEYAKVFAIGIAKARSPETSAIFSHYLTAINNELNIHGGYFDRLGITEDEIRVTKRSIDNLSYTSYMLRVAYEEGEVEILTAILSCACSYEMIARRMIANRPECVDDPFYGDWIRGYSSDEYADENIILTELINKITEDIPDEGLSHLIDVFTYCSRYEMKFWEMSWNMSL